MISSCSAASTVKCKKPQDPDHGRYKPDGRTFYKINEVITAVCNIDYYPWGEVTKQYCGLENGDSAWLPKSSKCSDSQSSDSVTVCLKPERYDEECKKKGGHAMQLSSTIRCSVKPQVKVDRVEPRFNESLFNEVLNITIDILSRPKL